MLETDRERERERERATERESITYRIKLGKSVVVAALNPDIAVNKVHTQLTTLAKIIIEKRN